MKTALFTIIATAILSASSIAGEKKVSVVDTNTVIKNGINAPPAAPAKPVVEGKQRQWATQPTDSDYWAKKSTQKTDWSPAPAKGSLPPSTQLVEKSVPRVTGYTETSMSGGIYPSYTYGFYPSYGGYYLYDGGYYPHYGSYSYGFAGAGFRIGGYNHCGVFHKHTRRCR